jgi:hypothetical protein
LHSFRQNHLRTHEYQQSRKPSLQIPELWQHGRLDAGKLAEIIILDGNPLGAYWNLLNAKVMIKRCEIMLDKC